MPNYLTVKKLEFSRDPLSDVTPAWTDISEWLRGASWGDGKNTELDEPQAGSAAFTLKNEGRRFEPEYAAGAYYPDIVPLRRFRLTLSDGVSTQQQGVWYATSYDVQYPARTAYSEVVVTCVDGFGLLALDLLDTMDPPDATSYDDVVAHDQPFGFWGLGEEEGTKLVARVRKRKRIGKNPYIIRPRRVRRFLVTAAEVEAETGNAGTYRNTPELGQPGLVLGSADTAVRFRNAEQEYATVPVDVDNFRGLKSLGLETLVKAETLTSIFHPLITGPDIQEGGGTTYQFQLALGADTNKFRFAINPQGGTGGDSLVDPVVRSAGTIYHVFAVWTGEALRLYIDGQLSSEVGASVRVLGQALANPVLQIGGRVAASAYSDATMAKVAVYEKPPSAERIHAHYLAARERGFPQQTAGQRIAAVATHDLWSEAKIHTGEFQVQPVFEYGQPKLEEIRDAVRAESPSSLFFFDGDGDPVYLGWNYQDGISLFTTNQENFETDTTGWPTLVNATKTQSSTQAYDGTFSLRLQATAASDMSVQTAAGTSGIPATPSKLYAADIRMRPQTTARTFFASMMFYESGGTQISFVDGADTLEVAGTWVKASVQAYAPANTAFVAVKAYVRSPGASEQHYLDGCSLKEPYDTPQATFGDIAGEVPYEHVELVYDDELFNKITVSADGGEAQTAEDTTSQNAYRPRAHIETGLLLHADTDANTVAHAMLDRYKDPRFRVTSITLNGANTLARRQILTRQLGDMIRVRRRGEGGTPIDIVTHIIGQQKTLDVSGHLVCTYQLARGLNAAADVWRLGITGFTELDETAVLA